MYTPELSMLLAQMSELTYIQYRNGPPPKNKGIVSLPSGYSQIASFTAPEIDLKTDLSFYKEIDWQKVKSRHEIRSIEAGLEDVYFGFAATSASHNIIALRGTQSIFEWVTDLDIPQVPVPLYWYNNGHFKEAKVHMGFLIFYVLLVDQIIEACNKFDNNLPFLVTGHSLGAALATLAAPTIKMITENKNVQMYNYASPRVGNPIFVKAYNMILGESYRVVNLSDLVPMIPPTKILSWEYAHVPEAWSFLNQSGNVAGNHALIGKDNYTDAVNKEIPTNAERKYPVTGL